MTSTVNPSSHPTEEVFLSIKWLESFQPQMFTSYNKKEKLNVSKKPQTRIISNFSQIATKWFLFNPVEPEAHTHTCRPEGQNTHRLLSDYILQKWMAAGSDQSERE